MLIVKLQSHWSVLLWSNPLLPVRNLLQVDLLVAVEELGDVVTHDPNKKGDEDNGQDHPHPNTGVQ